MVGLPGSTLDTEVYSIKKVLKLNPKCLRIYPVYVLKDSKLYEMYKNKEYTPLSVDDAIERVYYILKECKKTDVKIIRIGLQTTDEITSSNSQIVGPVCDNFAEYVLSKIVLDDIEKYISKNNINYEENIKKKMNIYTNNNYASIIVGPEKVNKKYLKERTKLFERFKLGKYFYDLAFQRYIIERCSLKKPVHYYLAVLNPYYVFDGTLKDGKPYYHKI